MTYNLNELSTAEKIKIVEDLWDSIADDQNVLSLTSEQKNELDKRLEGYKSDGIKGRSADVVIAAIRDRL